jgi:hypothetical protein
MTSRTGGGRLKVGFIGAVLVSSVQVVEELSEIVIGGGTLNVGFGASGEELVDGL